MPFTRLVDRRLVINSGSIEMPYGRPGGSRVVLADAAVTLRRTEVDPDRTVARVVAESTYPARRACAQEYLRTPTEPAAGMNATSSPTPAPPRTTPTSGSSAARASWPAGTPATGPL